MKKALLLAAYGSTDENNAMHLNEFEQEVRRSFPASSIRWAFTSLLMRNRLAAARKKTDSVRKALCRLGFERFGQVTVQSLHIIPGSEYMDMLAEIEQAKREGAPADISVGLPLLNTEEDISLAARAMARNIPAERRPEEAVIWVGHGTSHAGSQAYQRLTIEVQKQDRRILLGTLEEGIEPRLEELAGLGCTRAWLMPLLAVVGKHAAEDIGGKGEDSWRGRLLAGGVPCRVVEKGLVEYADFTAIWLRHLREAAEPQIRRGAGSDGP